MPGTGMCDPNRYNAIIINVNKILFRRSGILNTFFKLESTVSTPDAAGGEPPAG
jgi:hypothetical protein